MPTPTAAMGWMGRASRASASSTPTTTPQIWVRQASAEAVKVGPTADMAPMVANTTLAGLAPYCWTTSRDRITARAVFRVRSPTGGRPRQKVSNMKTPP